MTATINIQNKPVLPVQVEPSLKVVDHPSEDIKTEAGNVAQTKPPTKTKKTDTEEDISKANKAKESTEEKESSEQSLNEAVKQLNTYVQSINRNLEFNIDNNSGKTVVKVIDAETDELIRQIPNEEALNIAKQLDLGLDDDSSNRKLLLIRAKA
ncbi:MAG: flagellar protein FlaG [Methylococcaceae bacterium]